MKKAVKTVIAHTTLIKKDMHLSNCLANSWEQPKLGRTITSKM